MFLVLDFSKTFNMAIIEKNSFFQRELKAKKNYSEILYKEIDNFLHKHNKNVKNIKAIYIITGPGSFTGIRVALTFAKALALIININIFGLSKFELLNLCLEKKAAKKRKRIFIHLKKNQFFIQNFVDNNPLDLPKLINFDHYRDQYRKDITYISDKELLFSLLNKNSKENFFFVNYSLNQLPQLIKKNMININEPKPLYISNYF